MKNITNKKILNIFTFCILIVIPLMKQLSFYLVKLNVMNEYDFINPAIVIYMSIPFLIFVYIKDIKDKKRKLDLYDYLFFILVVIGIIVTIFSMDKSISIFGKDYRHEGFLSILGYYLLFINWKVNGNKDDIIKYIKLFIIIGIINSIYAILQIYTSFDFILRYSNDIKMVSGLCGNPNFFGSLIVTVISMITCKFLMSKEITMKEIFLIILLFISLINSQSTGPFITYILLIILLIVFLFKKRCLVLKNMSILFIILVITYCSIYVINKYVYNFNRCEMCDINETVKTGGNGRLEIWKNSLNIVKDNPFIGVGFDNFYLAYSNPKNNGGTILTIENGVVKKIVLPEVDIVDNAHNIYLHNLVTMGILGLIPYLLLCLFTFIKGLKSKNKLIFILFSGFVAYSIQGFVNISVIQVAPIYFIIIGLILSENSRTKILLT